MPNPPQSSPDAAAHSWNPLTSQSAHNLPPPSAPAPPASARRTEAQVIGIATQFAKNVGLQLAEHGTAVYPAPVLVRGMQDNYWQPRWQVKFGDGVEFEIVDADGVICKFHDTRAMENGDANAPPGPALAEAKVRQRADVVLRSVGPIGEVGTPEVRHAQYTAPATAAGDVWFVVWPRTYRGVPYRSQQFTVQLQGSTGALIGLAAHYPSAPPASGAGAVSKADAEATANARLAQAGVTGMTLTRTSQQVVCPNTFWDQGGSVWPSTTASAVAWVCEYSAGGQGCMVCVDTTSGKVIGGEDWAVAGGPRRAGPPTR